MLRSFVFLALVLFTQSAFADFDHVHSVRRVSGSTFDVECLDGTKARVHIDALRSGGICLPPSPRSALPSAPPLTTPSLPGANATAPSGIPTRLDGLRSYGPPVSCAEHGAGAWYLTRISDGAKLGMWPSSKSECDSVVKTADFSFVCTQQLQGAWYPTRISDGKTMGASPASLDECKTAAKASRFGIVCAQQAPSSWVATRVSDGLTIGKTGVPLAQCVRPASNPTGVGF